MSSKTIKTALISVYHKDGLDIIVKKLNQLGVRIISTGGTCDYINSLSIPVEKVENLTGYPDLFGGRVKTLHPLVMGGILHRRDMESDVNQALEHDIPPIDLVIVDLYPFEETVKKTDIESDIIEKIDIGGISLIRAAAKNFNDVLIVASRNQYDDFANILEQGNGTTNIQQRRHFAAHAFQVSSHYDTQIFNYFNNLEQIAALKLSFDKGSELRYGENPHQKGYFFGNIDELFQQLNGKELSFNNFQDLESAFELISEFDQPTFVIVKHGNACGVAMRETVEDAWDTALSCDPLSAFGGVITSNREIDKETAEKMNDVFFEVLLAPGFSQEAIEILKSRKNRILLSMNHPLLPNQMLKSCLNGLLVQERDNNPMDTTGWKVVTEREVPESIYPTLLFANRIVRHTKSNAIVVARNRMLLGSGMGQTSRVDAVKLALSKAKAFKHDIRGSVMASDAFFPFSDGIEHALNEGIEYIIQPGGSIRDQDVIDFCNNNKIAMIFTGKRHFKH